MGNRYIHRYTVEVGKNKSAYTVQYSFDGIPSLGRAYLHYNSLNTHSGHKKRLVRTNLITGKRTILHRTLT